MHIVFDDIDSYKASHYAQFRPGILATHYYAEARTPGQQVTFFGLQPILKKLSKRIKLKDLNKAEALYLTHGIPFHRKGWEDVLDRYDGYLPITIKAVPEGSVIPSQCPLFTVQSNDLHFPWVPSLTETMLVRLWYPCTVATNSRNCLMDIKERMEISCDTLNSLPYKLHDFGSRGVSSRESARIGGAAHLINARGTDTVTALRYIQKHYSPRNSELVSGESIPAAEHSTITSWLRSNEEKAYMNMLQQFRKYPVIAIVIDSYDMNNALHIFGTSLKETVERRAGLTVLRPDSGDPLTVVLNTLTQLEKYFGVTQNLKGYKVLNNVRVIQGDGISPAIIPEILDAVLEKGFSAENVSFGMGSGLLQDVRRDDLGFAMKLSAACTMSGWEDIWKQPSSDPNKASKRGRQALVRRNGQLVARRYEAQGKHENLLETVFENGRIRSRISFTQVRQNSSEWIQNGT